MNKQEFETMKKIFSAGEFDGVKVKVVNTPRFFVKVGANNEIWLDGKQGLANGRDHNRDWVLKKLKASLTSSFHLGEAFQRVCADRVTSDTENGSLQLMLGHYGVNEYSGTLKTKRLETLVALNEGSIESVESAIGLNASTNNRLVFNLIGSEACSTKKVYDRVKMGRLSTLAIGVFGCANNVWVKSGATANDFNVDKAQCNAQTYSVPFASVYQQIAIQNQCMQGKGWTLKDKAGYEATNSAAQSS